MDEKDSLIYLILNENGRAKLTQVARELGFSHPSTKDRLQKLISNQEIKVKALLNVKKRNWKVAVCNIRAENMESAAKLVDAFKKCPRVIFLQTLTGSYNLIMIAVAQSTTILQYFIETEVRSQPGIRTLDISIGDSPVLPEFLDIKNPRKKEDVPPCGINNCATCYLYQKDCEGCPATKYFRRSNHLL